MIGFLLYKVYTNIFDKNDSTPWLRTFLYVCLIEVFVVFFIFLMAEGILAFCKINIQLDKFLYIIILGIIPCLYTYFRFFYGRDIKFYAEKYEFHWMNKYYFNGLLIVVPFIIFISAPITRIVIFGGEMFNHKIDGLINW